MELNNETIEAIHSEMNGAVADILKKYGLKLQKSTIRYSQAILDFKITSRLLGEDGLFEVDNVEQSRSNWYLLSQESDKKDIIGKHIRLNLAGFGGGTIISFNNRSKKYGVTKDTEKGSRYDIRWSLLKQAEGLD